jgi:hypothetical protein
MPINNSGTATIGGNTTITGSLNLIGGATIGGTGLFTQPYGASGQGGDWTGVSTPTMKISPTSGYARIIHTSVGGTVSVVYNYESGKHVYWGEDTDTGTYYFRGKSVNMGSSLTVGSTITENSSIRYKDNIETVKYGLDKVLQMRGVTYTKKDTGLKELGLIAEELNEILPEVVLKNEEGEPDSVSYGRITAVLIEAIKDLKKEIEELKSNK